MPQRALACATAAVALATPFPLDGPKPGGYHRD